MSRFRCCVAHTRGSQGIFMHSGPQKMAFWEMLQWWNAACVWGAIRKHVGFSWRGQRFMRSVTGMTEPSPSVQPLGVLHCPLPARQARMWLTCADLCSTNPECTSGIGGCVCVFANKKFFSPPSWHFSGGLAFLARRGSNQVVVLLLWLKYKEEGGLQMQEEPHRSPCKPSN